MIASSRHVVVVGAGVFGAAAALELARRGWSVTLVDRGPVPHPEASSTDVSKLARMEYGSDLLYHELAEEALEGWDRWNREWPRPLFHEDGLLVLRSGAMTPGSFELESWKALRDRGHRAERLDGAGISRRFGAWRTAPDDDGFFNPRAGWVESGAVVERLVALGRAEGVRPVSAAVRTLALEGTRVTGVEIEGGETLRADEVLVAAGAWTPSLLPSLAGVLEAVAQPVLLFRPDDPRPFSTPAFPPWAFDIARTGWYGFPALADGRVKVGHHGEGERVDPHVRGELPDGHEERCRAFLRDRLPGLAEAPLAGSRVCLYCDAFDGDLLVARDPDRGGLTVASGGSGHAFKFAPLLGALAADALEGRENRWSHRFRWRAPAERHREEARFDG